MQICKKCKRFLSNSVQYCIYCQHTEIEEIGILKTFEKVPYNDNLILNNEVYIIKRLIGHGGFGSVLEVEEKSTKNRYAFKIPLSGTKILYGHIFHNENEIVASEEMIQKEILLLKKINHPGIMTIVSDGFWEPVYKGNKMKIPYYLMELAEGDLESLLTKIHSFSFDEKVKIIKEISSSLAFLHKNGIVYRDMSLKNILIVDKKERGIHYILTDFGTYKDIASSTMTMGGKSQLVGTSRYICPAYFQNMKKYRKDPRVDVYSLGILSTEIILGISNWTKLIDEEYINPILIDFPFDVLNPLIERNDLPKEIGEILIKATQKEPENRYENAEGFLRDLEDMLLELTKTKILSLNNTTYPLPQITLTEDKRITAINIPFRSTIKLPLIPTNKTSIMTKAKFENKEIELSNSEGIEIILPRNLKFKSLKIIKGPAFYDILASKTNSILITLNSEKLKKVLMPLLNLNQNIKGELTFKGIIQVER